MTVVVVIAVIVVLAIVLGLVLRQRSGNDGVDSFRRQIDALSPEARRPTIDKLKSVERGPDDAEDEEEESEGS